MWYVFGFKGDCRYLIDKWDGILHARGESLKTKERQARKQRVTEWRSNQNMCTSVCAWLRNRRTARDADIGHAQSTTYCRESQLFFLIFPYRLLRINWVCLDSTMLWSKTCVKYIHHMLDYITDCTALRVKVQYHTALEWLNKTIQENNYEIQKEKRSD